MTQNCGQCVFWEGANRKVGECHRYPPHASGPSMTREFDWCGEFSPAAARQRIDITSHTDPHWKYQYIYVGPRT